MGQAKRRKQQRKQQLGALYGTPEGSNRATVAQMIKVRRSDISGKWAVDIDLPRGSRRLTVYMDRSHAMADAAIAAQFFGAHTAQYLEDPANWLATLQAYSKATQAAGLEDDDEVLSVMRPLSNGFVLIDETRKTLDHWNAQLREQNILSDRVWYRDRKGQ